jgi:hypothetical protein
MFLRRERSHIALLMLFILAGVLVTLEYLHLDTLISANKHDDFGAWFTCIAGGYTLARTAELAHSWYAKIPVILFSASVTILSVFVYISQASGFFTGSSSVPQALTLRTYLTVPSRNYLLGGQQPMVIPYYLHINIPWEHLVDDNYIKYPLPGHGGMLLDRSQAVSVLCFKPGCVYLEGVAGYKAAIHNHYFAVAAFPTGELSNSWDRMELQTVETTPGYRLLSTVGGPSFIYVPDFLKTSHH